VTSPASRSARQGPVITGLAIRSVMAGVATADARCLPAWMKRGCAQWHSVYLLLRLLACQAD
jgi:hypothetical protein